MPSAELLERYAEVAIGVGINVEPGDRVVISSPIQLPEFTRIMVEKAYNRGAHSVDLIWTMRLSSGHASATAPSRRPQRSAE